MDRAVENLTIPASRPRSRRVGLSERLVLDRLEALAHGGLELVLPDGSRRHFGNRTSGRQARLEVHDPRVFRRLVQASDVGIGEGYRAGEWSSPDLVSLVRLFLANEDLLSSSPWLGAVSGAFNRLRHALRANTRAGARRNIAAHYDLSNELYSLFLDPSMSYSAAYFATPETSLEEAQHAKYHRLAEMAGLEPGQQVLEIGCGWGGFAEVAARDFGCRVTGLTLSTEQAAYARQRMRRLGLAKQVEIRLEDYRDAHGSYDALVSIEMLEAVGHRFLGDFFAACERLLAPHGRMALQVISIPDQIYDRYRRGTDWIRQVIFPGGHLPSLGAMQQAMASSSRLAVEQLDNIASHYAETLRRWRSSFLARRPEVLALGFDEAFLRTWEFYLATCEALFAHRKIGSLQLALARPSLTPMPPGPYGGAR